MGIPILNKSFDLYVYFDFDFDFDTESIVFGFGINFYGNFSNLTQIGAGPTIGSNNRILSLLITNVNQIINYMANLTVRPTFIQGKGIPFRRSSDVQKVGPIVCHTPLAM